MAASFLRNWFAKSAPASPDVGEALAELERAARERPTLADSLNLLSDLLPKMYDAIPLPPVLPLDQETATAKLAAGVPILRGENFSVDSVAHCQRWLGLCSALRSHHHDVADALADAVRRERLRPDTLLLEILAGRPETLAAQAEELGLDGGLAATLLRLHWFPVLAVLKDNLAALRAGIAWEYGYCPTCGINPLLAELRGLEQGRFLRCGLCAAAWEVPRLFCPFCGARDHHALGYFQIAGEETRCRVTTCDACGRYVKTVSTLSELAGPQLLAADAATLHLDLAAAERGYVV